ncbi:MAG: hypothetical protein MZV64_23380 [Ignavibacteriales bacterium]|nr:hypothetical protein [Ignavibacteriales bacterium]
MKSNARCSHRQNSRPSLADVDADAYDNKVIRDYSRRDGSLKTLPSQRKKLEAILRHVVKVFDVGKALQREKRQRDPLEIS